MSITLPSRKLKIFINAIDGAGHMNACVGIAQALAKRGHKVYFLINSVFAPQYEKFGFEQILLESKHWGEGENEVSKPKDGKTENPFKVFVKLLRESGLLSNLTSAQKMKAWAENTALLAEFYDASLKFDPQIKAAIEREHPDLLIQDQMFISPSIQMSGIPWIFMLSANPLVVLGSDKLPPAGSGYSTADDSKWAKFRQVKSLFDEVKPSQIKLNLELGYDPPEYIDPNVKLLLSKYLNIYQFPQELDYHDIITIPSHFSQVDAFCLEIPEPFKLPDEFVVSPGEKLVYVSLGSMGSIDVELMKRIVSILGKSAHKFIISKGPLHDEYDLPPNCWGEAYLPQTRVLPLVDLVITHGGNNTVTEAFSFGKPLIVLPLFGDQFDNAQRVQEKGYGIRLEPYDIEEDQLINAIDLLLTDTKTNERCKLAASRIEQSKSKEKLCAKIESIVEEALSLTKA